MYNQKVLIILAKTLGVITLIGAGILFISGFFMAGSEMGTTAEKVGFFIGYQVAGLGGLAFIYVLLGTLSNINAGQMSRDTETVPQTSEH